MVILSSPLESAALVIALSMDAFVSCFAYGTNKIKIPLKSILVMNIVCKVILGLSFLCGRLFKGIVPHKAAYGICFTILFLLGLSKLFDSTIKTIIKKHNKIDTKLKFSIFSLNFILNIYANPEDADIDKSRELSPKEAAFLAVALSLDGLSVGFGAGLVSINILQIICFSFVSDFAATLLGCYSGNRIAEKSELNLSWLSGLMLLAMAIGKL